MHAVARRLVPEVAGPDVDAVDRRRTRSSPPAIASGERAVPPGGLAQRRARARPTTSASSAACARGARARPRPRRPGVGQAQLHAPVVVEVGDADLAPERPGLQERHAGERPGEAAPACGRRARGRRCRAPPRRAAPSARVDGPRRGRGRRRRAAPAPRAGRRRARSSAACATTDRRRCRDRPSCPGAAPPWRAGTARSRRPRAARRSSRVAGRPSRRFAASSGNGSSAPQRRRWRGTPVELVVAGHRDVDGQLAQREERPDAVAERAERAALGEVARVDPQPAAACVRRSSTVACSAAAPGSRAVARGCGKNEPTKSFVVRIRTAPTPRGYPARPGG